MPFGEHGRQHVLRWGARRWRRRDAGRDVAGDPGRHLVTQSRFELAGPGEELARQLGLLAAQPRQLQRRCPPLPARGGIAGGGASLGPRSLITTVPANTSPIRLPFGDSTLQITAGPPKNIQISIDRGQRAKQRLAEPFRAAVVGDHPQAQRHLAQRPARVSRSRTPADSRPAPAR